MHYKKLNPSFDPYKKELPPYLGYGQLDEESVHYGDKETLSELKESLEKLGIPTEITYL